MSTLLVVGATGSIGRCVVDEATRQGYTVRALVRDPRKVPRWPAGIEIVVGDVTRRESLVNAAANVSAVIFVHGTYGGDQDAAEAVDYGAVRNILSLLQRTTRIALMTTIAVTDRRGVHDWKRRGERLVRASGLPYTIVRPGTFDSNRPDDFVSCSCGVTSGNRARRAMASSRASRSPRCSCTAFAPSRRSTRPSS